MFEILFHKISRGNLIMLFLLAHANLCIIDPRSLFINQKKNEEESYNCELERGHSTYRLAGSS
jgi:hypothetical protein